MDCCKYSFQDYVFAIFIRFCQHCFCFVYVQHVSRNVMLVSVSWLGLVILALTCHLFCEISYCENFILVIVLSLFSQLPQFVSCLFWHSWPSLSFIDILCLATCQRSYSVLDIQVYLFMGSLCVLHCFSHFKGFHPFNTVICVVNFGSWGITKLRRGHTLASSRCVKIIISIILKQLLAKTWQERGSSNPNVSGEH